MLTLDILIGLGLGTIVYAWFLYPFLLRLLPARPPTRRSEPAAALPVAVILSAHNEEKHLRERVQNIRALSYPRERVAIYLGNDGSSDRTCEIAADLAAADAGLHVTDRPDQRGKIAMLKDLVAVSSEPILLFTDANSMFQPHALDELIAHFDDPSVGGVCGRLVFLDAAGAPSDEGVYWRWETRLKILESAIDSCIGANGAIYAIRRELFWDLIPANTIVDDFVIGMKVREQGFRLLYEPRAQVHEELPPDVAQEWGRRVRIGSGDFQALSFCSRLLSPSYGAFAWMFLSHKVLRWFTPHLLLVVGLAAVFNMGSGISMVTLAGLLVCAGLLAGTFIGQIVGDRRIAGFGLVRQCRYFMIIQAALFCGFLRYCRGGLAGHWDRTGR
ncbi:MAG: glycosyltransferase family 2 protein [Verrucomicrobia bacterium]|nr:glycosyltransferase family 2 protein [Verrucomicrobiota bacterium]